jgi:LuxR family transcriptional regulator, maltose regulon positive regulatory protein
MMSGATIANPIPTVSTVPELPPGYVPRDRLTAQLDAAIRSPLTLVTAPAGWGKTVALAAWARANTQQGVRWLTASEDGGADVARQLLAALTYDPATGRLPDEFAGAGLAGAGLAAAVDRLEQPTAVVIDDVHQLSDAEVLAELETLVRHGMGNLRLLMACRTDPALPLYRWRVNGSLTELRTTDLSLSIQETGGLLETHGINLPSAALYELHAWTEGWPAAVRLAAMAMRGDPEPARVLDDKGDFVVAVEDYLNGEVVDRLPVELRQIVTDTAVAPRLTAGLVEALTGREDGARVLSELRQANAFITRCPGPGGWYRYHPLFATTLHSGLLRQTPERVPELHGRAARWHAAYGLPAEAVRHSLLAGDWKLAVDVLERHWPDIVGGVRYGHTHEVSPAPPSTEQTDPRLALAFCADRLRAGDLDGARDYLRLTQRTRRDDALEEHPPVVPMVAAFEGAEAWLSGDPRRALAAAAQLTPSGNSAHAEPTDEVRALALLSEGEARLRLGELGAAGAPLYEALLLAQRAGMAQAQVSAASHLAVLEAIRGRLRTAARTARQALVSADRFGITDANDLGWVRVALATVYGEWNRGAEAGRLLDEALDFTVGDPDLLVTAATIRAKLLLADGRIAVALETLHDARRDLGGVPVAPAVERALALSEAEVRIAAGDLTAARRLAATGGDPSIFLAWAAIIDGSCSLVEGKPAAAAAAVAPYATVSAEFSLSSTVQAGIVTALAGRALGDRDRVMRGLEIALDVADAEGFRRPFLAGGAAVRELLTSFAPSMPVYRPNAADLAAEMSVADLSEAGRPFGPRGMDAALAEPLTEREMTILRYLQGTMSNLEIASTLYVSVNTVKTHVKNIYRKLHAGRRREAVDRARELRLI